MQRLEVSGAVRPIYGSLGVKRLNTEYFLKMGAPIRTDTVPRTSVVVIYLFDKWKYQFTQTMTRSLQTN